MSNHYFLHIQAWKFPKGFNVRDLKSLTEPKPEPLLGLPGEVMPSETGHKAHMSERSDTSSDSASSRWPAGGRRASLLLPGKEDPKWLSLQQVCCVTRCPGTRLIFSGTA